VASVADELGRIMAREKIRLMFGFPGGVTVDLAEMASRHGVEFVLAHSEWSAGYMAGMYGDLTGLPGVLVTTLGPGATNAVNATAHAYLDRQPALIFTGCTSLHQASHSHQRLDQRAIFAPVTKWSTTVTGHGFAAQLRRGMRIATDERPGPVHFDVPADQTRAECAGTGEGSLSEYQRAYGPAGNLDQACKLLRSARRPLVVAGNTARRRGASGGIRRLAEACGMPVVTTPKAKGVIDEGHPLWAGVIEMAGHHFMADFVEQADLILAVGFDPVELITPWRHSAPVVHIDYLPNTDDVYYSALDLVGDINATCEGIAAGAKGESRWTSAELATHRAEYLRRVTVRGPGLSPSAVVFAAREALPESAIVISDVGSHKMLLGGLWHTSAPDTFFMSNGLGSMGFGLPSAIAAQLVYPDRKVVCCTGDGGLAMMLGELGTIADRELPILTIVFNDGALDRIRRKQWAENFRAIGTEFGNPDFVKLAESFGLAAYRATTAGEFDAALANALTGSGPCLIEAKINPEEYEVQFKSLSGLIASGTQTPRQGKGSDT
jgi:acetolactate synthase I/II/III large subunit